MEKKFRFALIGCGKVARKHMKAIEHNMDLVELVALVDTDAKAMERLLDNSSLSAEHKTGIICYQDYRQMLDEQKPDIVAITTPSGTHAKIGLDAIRKGANLILEKPMTLSLHEAGQLIQEAAKFNVKIALGHIYRFFPFVDQIVKDIADNMYGKVLYGDVKVRWGHDQAYYDQAPWRGTWKQDGGVLMNQSIHALDLMCWLVGSEVTEVAGMLARQKHKMEAEDLALGIMRFKNGAYCTIEGTTNTDKNKQEASFYLQCTKGIIKAGIRSGRPYLDIRDDGGKKIAHRYIWKLLKDTMKKGGLSDLRKLGNPHSGIVRDLCLSIIGNTSPRADGLSGRNALEIVLAIYKAAKTEESVKLPLDGFSTDDMTGFFDK
ncbi:MAG: Gfo/Idh/MocA family protein [Saccharofermentanales bacterium]